MASSRFHILTLASILLVASLALISCDDKAGANVEPVKIAGTWFHLEIASDDPVRMRGLGGRDYIAPDGGMIFVFTNPQPLAFVMRDCLAPIDIAFLDAAGRVVSMHEMPIEAPRRPNESPAEYEQRLTQYPSRFPAQFAVETARGRLKEVGVKVGDKLELDAASLKRLAR